VPRWVPFVLVLALAAHLAFELTRFPAERASEISRWERELSALADDRRRSLTELLRSDSLDVRAIAGARRVELFVREGPDAAGEATPGLVQDVLDRFSTLRRDTLHGTWIVSGHGAVLASAAGITPPDPACLEALATVGAGQPGPIHRHGAVTIVPIAAAIDLGAEPRGGDTAAVLFAFDAAPLFSRLARRPSQPRTVESYLVRRHEGRLQFLSPLLFGEPAAEALDDPKLGARAAAEGRDSFSEGLDYRHDAAHPVLTVTRALPGTGWGLVVEVDVPEALAPLEEQVRSRRLLWAVIWFGIFALVYAASRAQRAAVALESGRVASRYSARLDQANDAILIMDEAGRILEVNRRAMEFYERTEDELLAMPGRDLRAPDTRAEADRNIQHAFSSGAGLFEAVHVRASGSRFPVEISARVVTDEPGERRIVVVVRDITARKADAERIARLNRLLRTRSTVSEVLMRSPDERQLFEAVCRISVEQAGFLVAWVGLADRATGKVEVAARAGVEQDFLDGIEVRFDEGPLANGPTGTAIREERTVKIASLADDRLEPWSEKGRAHGFGSSASTPIRRSAQVIGALTLYSPVSSAFDPEICGLIEEMAADIGFALTAVDTRRRQAEADTQVRETERRFRTVLENLPLLVVAVDEQARVVFWNRGAEQITGIGPQAIGQPLPIDELYPDAATRRRANACASRGGGVIVRRLAVVATEQHLRTVGELIEEEHAVGGRGLALRLREGVVPVRGREGDLEERLAVRLLRLNVEAVANALGALEFEGLEHHDPSVSQRELFPAEDGHGRVDDLAGPVHRHQRRSPAIALDQIPERLVDLDELRDGVPVVRVHANGRFEVRQGERGLVLELELQPFVELSIAVFEIASRWRWLCDRGLRLDDVHARAEAHDEHRHAHPKEHHGRIVPDHSTSRRSLASSGKR
jgi:PAS domain S-box-containing protein